MLGLLAKARSSSARWESIERICRSSASDDFPNGFDDTYCDAAGNFNAPAFVSRTLSPCSRGWDWSLLGPNPGLFPFTKVGEKLSLSELDLEANETYSFHCEEADGKIRCKEASSPLIVLEASIPDGADYFAFEYMFDDVGDGDYASVLIDGQPLWLLAGDNFFGSDFLDSGLIPLQGITGKHEITIGLYGVGEPNAEFSVRNLRTLFTTASTDVPEPAGLLLVLTGIIFLKLRRRSRSGSEKFGECLKC